MTSYKSCSNVSIVTMIVKHGFKSLVKDAVMINYLSLYLCRYGLRGKEVVGVALVELKSLLVNMRN